SACRLMNSQAAVHALAIEAEIQIIAAVAADAARGELAAGIFERAQLDLAAHLQRCGDARELRPQLQLIDRRPCDIDDRYRACLRFGRRDGQALEGYARD